MITLDQATLDRMVDVLTPKARHVAELAALDGTDPIRDVVTQVVVDASLILDGSIPLGHWNDPTEPLPLPGNPTVNLLEPCDGPAGPPLSVRQLRRWWWRRQAVTRPR